MHDSLGTVVEYLYCIVLFILCSISCYSLWKLGEDPAANEINRGMDFLEKMKKIDAEKTQRRK